MYLPAQRPRVARPAPTSGARATQTERAAASERVRGRGVGSLRGTKGVIRNGV